MQAGIFGRLDISIFVGIGTAPHSQIVPYCPLEQVDILIHNCHRAYKLGPWYFRNRLAIKKDFAAPGREQRAYKLTYCRFSRTGAPHQCNTGTWLKINIQAFDKGRRQLVIAECHILEGYITFQLLYCC